ncbi:WHI2-like protein [Smittium culicis]|uniref:WHI2-like protein n=1 Tax=Smittium culicis TaxID=133412 RepID=A0A1R1YSZ7_9FUNG|nr:WHI2-like protein [Smittium culicis]
MADNPITSVSYVNNNQRQFSGIYSTDVNSELDEIGLESDGKRLVISRRILSSFPDTLLIMMFPNGMLNSLNRTDQTVDFEELNLQYQDRNEFSYDAESPTNYYLVNINAKMMNYISDFFGLPIFKHNNLISKDVLFTEKEESIDFNDADDDVLTMKRASGNQQINSDGLSNDSIKSDSKKEYEDLNYDFNNITNYSVPEIELKNDSTQEINTSSSTDDSAMNHYNSFTIESQYNNIPAIIKKTVVVMLKEDLDYYVVPNNGITDSNKIARVFDKNGVLQDYDWAKAVCGDFLKSQYSIFDPVMKPDSPRGSDNNEPSNEINKTLIKESVSAQEDSASHNYSQSSANFSESELQLNPVEVQLIQMLYSSGFSSNSKWGCRTLDSKSTSIVSLSMVIMGQFDEDSQELQNKQIYGFYKKPAIKCWWNSVQFNPGIGNYNTGLVIWCRRVWTLELVLV